MKEYTQKELEEIELKINNLISVHDRWNIKELCQSEEYALYYFVNKAIETMTQLEHIKRILED